MARGSLSFFSMREQIIIKEDAMNRDSYQVHRAFEGAFLVSSIGDDGHRFYTVHEGRSIVYGGWDRELADHFFNLVIAS